MDIAAMSTTMKMQEAQMSASMLLMRKAMDTQSQSSEMLLELMETAVPAAPISAGGMDISV